jgi:hypothetical protein
MHKMLLEVYSSFLAAFWNYTVFNEPSDGKAILSTTASTQPTTGRMNK